MEETHDIILNTRVCVCFLHAHKAVCSSGLSLRGSNQGGEVDWG